MLDIKSTVATWSIGQNAVKTDGSLEFYNGSSTPIFFTTGGAVTVGADLTITSGNLVIGTAGKGIDFSAVTGGTGTSTSNLLDDYEEGTWVPQDVNGSALGGNGAGYVKIGNICLVYFDITYSGGVNSSTVKNLPFSVFNAQYNSGVVSYTTVGAARGILANANTSTFDFTNLNSAFPTAAGARFIGSLTYRTA
mgnify:CR=1 FL=1